MSEKNIQIIESLEMRTLEHEHKVETHLHKAEEAKAETRRLKELEAARYEATKESAEIKKVLEKLKASNTEAAKDNDISNRPIGPDLKKSTFNKEIRHIRRKLNKTDRLGSRIIHQPIVRTVSEASSKTITRPSGLLGGGLVAFLGTTTYLYLAKHIGLTYNYSVFLFLLVIGFVLGLIAETLVHVFKGRRTV
jgi:hypothetical protein